MASGTELPVKLYYRIGEVAEVVGVETHVLRYWETEFGTIRPQKSPKGQRVYSRKDVEKLLRVKQLLYVEGYTIAGAKKKLREPFSPGSHTPPSVGAPPTDRNFPVSPELPVAGPPSEVLEGPSRRASPLAEPARLSGAQISAAQVPASIGVRGDTRRMGSSAVSPPSLPARPAVLALDKLPGSVAGGAGDSGLPSDAHSEPPEAARGASRQAQAVQAQAGRPTAAVVKSGEPAIHAVQFVDDLAFSASLDSAEPRVSESPAAHAEQMIRMRSEAQREMERARREAETERQAYRSERGRRVALFHTLRELRDEVAAELLEFQGDELSFHFPSFNEPHRVAPANHAARPTISQDSVSAHSSRGDGLDSVWEWDHSGFVLGSEAHDEVQLARRQQERETWRSSQRSPQGAPFTEMRPEQTGRRKPDRT